MKLLNVCLLSMMSICLLGSMTSAQEIAPPKKATAAMLKLKMQQDNAMQRRERIALALKELEIEKTNLAGQLETVFRKQDDLGVSSEGFVEVMKMLQGQRIQLTIDLAGLDARRTFLTKANDELQKEQNTGVLTKILDLEKDKLNRLEMLRERGSASESDVLEARKNVMLAELRIAESPNASPQVANMQNDLLETSLERAEKQARLEKVQEMLASLTEARATFQMAEQINKTVDSIDRRVLQQREEIDSIEKQLELMALAIEEESMSSK